MNSALLPAKLWLSRYSPGIRASWRTYRQSRRPSTCSGSHCRPNQSQDNAVDPQNSQRSVRYIIKLIIIINDIVASVYGVIFLFL